MKNDCNEGALVERARNGDSDAFGELVVRYAASVSALAYQHVGDWEAARDISQTAFLKAYRSIDSLRESQSFRVWLFRIAINESVDFIRLSRTQKQTQLGTSHGTVEEIATREKQPLERLIVQEERAAVLAALDELPPRQRTVFVLRHFHGLSNAEIAETLSSSSNAVKVNLSYALKSLREKLARGSGSE
jgi:RNA polymerase sigma-70 factor (ECF subfamily)